MMTLGLIPGSIPALVGFTSIVNPYLNGQILQAPSADLIVIAANSGATAIY